MYTNQYEEHVNSQPDSSRWDGFDRGTDWEDGAPVERCIGLMRNTAGQVVMILETEFSTDLWYEVFVDGVRKFSGSDCRGEAINRARKYMQKPVDVD